MPNKPPPSGGEIARATREAAADAINNVANDLLGRAVEEAPIAEGTLRESGRGPINDETHRATEANLEAMVSFNVVYAAAQHEGKMEYMRDGKLITWIVKNHPLGGKSKYLEDPFKAQIPTYEEYVARKVRSELEKKYGG